MLEPKRNYILAENPTFNDVTEAGIIKSEEMIKQEQEEFSKSFRGYKVIKVGKDVKDIQPGEYAVISPAHFRPVALEGYILFPEQDVIATNNEG